MVVCGKCPNLSQRPVPGRGNVRAKIMLVGEAPGREEDEQQRPFIGQAGKILDEALESAGLSRSEVYVTNVVKCRPPDNRQPEEDEVAQCMKLLRKEIAVVHPKLIVLLGATALRAFFGGKQKITQVRGDMMTWMLGDEEFRVMPTLHPAYVLRNRTKIGDLVVDLQKAKAAVSEDSRKGKYELVKSVDRLAELVDRFKKARILAVDTETTGLTFWKDRVVGISMTDTEYEGYYVPLEVASPLFKNDLVDFWSDEDKPKVMSLLRDVLGSDVPKVGHNLKFDILMLRAASMPLSGTFYDTMLALYLLDENQDRSKSKSLKNYVGLWSDLQGYKDVVEGVDSYAMLSLDVLWEYGAKDADAVMRLLRYLEPKIEAEELTWMWNEYVPAALGLVSEIEYRGMCVDAAYARQQAQLLEAEVSQMVEDLRRSVGDPKFNPNSAVQVKRMFMSRYGIEVSDTTKETMASLEYPEAQKISEIRKTEKIISTYLTGVLELLDGNSRVHSEYNLSGADTGRISSSSPNLQNIPARNPRFSKLVKKMFVATPGYRLIGYDYSQAEFRLAAWISQDAELIAAVERGVDFHKYTASIIYQIPEQEVTKEQRSIAKNMNFAMLYGAGASKVAESTGLSVDEAKKVMDTFFRRAPKFKEMIEGFHSFAQENGYVVSLLGRRRRLPMINDREDHGKSLRLAVNAPIQGDASAYAICNGWKTFLAMKKEGIESYPINIVHDAVYWECQDSDEVAESASVVMKTEAVVPVGKIRIKMDIDLSQGKDLSEL